MSEQQPIVADLKPAKVTLEKGEEYYYCACGKSSNQPFCDGSHKGTEFSPVELTVEKKDTFWLCGCKATANQPHCDGTHSKL